MFQGLQALPRTLELRREAGSFPARLAYVDQRALPENLVIKEAQSSAELFDAISSLSLRGAPAIGVAGAAILVLFIMNECEARDPKELLEQLEGLSEKTLALRPTAVNLSWALGRMMRLARQSVAENDEINELKERLFSEVKLMERQDEATNRRIGEIGERLIPQGGRVLTHCNAGSLATVFFGTALGLVYTAAAQGKIERVYVDETRPVGQGARLSAWELDRVGIPTTLLADDMAAVLMAQGKVDLVLVGADRICANGDTANKIGTYSLAIAARYHKLPFYVVAPSSSIDMQLQSGKDVVIEHRSAGEFGYALGAGVEAFNPAFDITPAELITAIVTEQGIFAPFELAAGFGCAH